MTALDKLETIIQHHRGGNPPGFDCSFDLKDGRQDTAIGPLVEKPGAQVGKGTRRNAARAGTRGEIS